MYRCSSRVTILCTNSVWVAIYVMQEPAKKDDTRQKQPEVFGQLRMEWYLEKKTFKAATD